VCGHGKRAAGCRSVLKGHGESGGDIDIVVLIGTQSDCGIGARTRQNASASCRVS
jgi:hypothetical protein